jgi:membrane dipeptidase
VSPRFALDGHADTVQRIVDLGERFTDPHSQAEVSLVKARAGGLGGQLFSIWVDPVHFPGEAAWPRTLRLIEAVLAQALPGEAEPARSASEIRANRDRGVFSLLLGLEGAHGLGADDTPVADRLARVGELAALGVRYVSPTWSNSNSFAGSSGDKGKDRGLSSAGFDLLEVLAATNILPDVSHVSDPSFDDMAAWSLSVGKPLIASHSSARALASSVRNLTDAQLHSLADCGGVAGVNFCPSFLEDRFRAQVHEATGSPEAKQAETVAREAETEPGRASLFAWFARSRFARTLPAPGLSFVADHIVHMLAKAGEDGVALGSDFDGISAVPTGLEDTTCLPILEQALKDRGVTSRVLDKVWSENWLRVLDT